MITLLKEWEQHIHVDSSTELKQQTIKYALYEAYKHRRYAKFYSNRYYINVAFNYDGTVQFSSNYFADTKFRRELNKLEGYKYSLNSTTYFIWYWMNKIRKL